MAYSYTQMDVDLGVQVLSSTGDKVWWAPGYIPHSVRAIALIPTVVPTGVGTVNFTSQPTAYSNVGITAGDIAIFVMSAPQPTLGQVIYRDTISDKIIKPGMAIVVNVSAAVAGFSATPHLYLEQSFEVPVNNAQMLAR
jgi:hypothetical protein